MEAQEGKGMWKQVNGKKSKVRDCKGWWKVGNGRKRTEKVGKGMWKNDKKRERKIGKEKEGKEVKWKKSKL